MLKKGNYHSAIVSLPFSTPTKKVIQLIINATYIQNYFLSFASDDIPKAANESSNFLIVRSALNIELVAKLIEMNTL